MFRRAVGYNVEMFERFNELVPTHRADAIQKQVRVMNTANPCIFCEIVAGKAEASVIYQDDRVMAFMTLRPVRPGECTIIPKQHIDHFTDIRDDVAAHLMVIAQKIGRRMRSEYSPKRVGFVVHGFGVPHAHLIIVPQHDLTDIVSGRQAYLKDGQINFGIAHLPNPSREELDRHAQRLSHLE